MANSELKEFTPAQINGPKNVMGYPEIDYEKPREGLKPYIIPKSFRNKSYQPQVKSK